MYTNVTIKKLISLLLFLVFLFSNTPKKFLHDAIADHQDSSYGTMDHQTTVERSGINCHFDHLVTESPFTADIVLFNIQPEGVFSSQILEHRHTSLQKAWIVKDNKGPPAQHC